MRLSSGSALPSRALSRLAGVTAAQLALARAGAGVSMITQPTVLPRALGVDSASAATMAWSTRMLGAREIALGLGAFTALRSSDRRASRLWLLAGLFSDGVDAVAVASGTARRRLHPVSGAAVTALACGAVVVQLAELRGRHSG